MTENKNLFDVIIIGAGPAGLACAQTLASSAQRVLVLEQKEVIGPKVCAGGLTRKDLRHIRIPASVLDREFCRFSLHTPLLSVELRDPQTMIATVDRKRFAEWQLSRLADARNVEIRTGCQVVAITENSVTLADDTTLGYRHLVGADGSFSRVRSFLGLPTEKIAVAIQYVVPTGKFDKMEYFLDARRFKSWYAWIFPHADYTSIGCMCDARYLSSKRMQENFNDWLRRQGIDVGIAKREGYGINYDYRGFCFGNVFLVGDAAGLASGLTGEGIYQAIVSGEEAAKTILDPGYEAPHIQGLLRTKELHETAMRRVLGLGPLGNLLFTLLAPLIRSRRIALRLLKYVD